MEVIRETLWKRCLSTPIKPPAKSSNICLSETAYQHKGTRRKCKKTNQAAIIQWQRQCIMDKPHCKPWPKSKTNDISKQSPSPLHHTFLLGRARFTAQPLSALLLQVNAPLTEKTWDEVELFSFWKLKWRTLHSFQDWELQLELGEIMAFERIIKQNNYWIRLSYHINNYGDLGGCYPPRRTVSTDNTLLDLDNSS